MGSTMEPTAASQIIGASPEDDRRGIQALLAAASLEISSRDPAEIDACAGLLEPGTAVTISMPPGQTYHGTVALAARLKRAGFRPVPHVAARRIASREALDEYLARAAGEAGVDGALVIAGDSDRASGPFDSSLALLETGLFQRHGIVHIGVAGYPEGHPKIAGSALDSALAAKKSLARRAGLDLQVTQFCFEAGPEVVVRDIARRGGAPIAGVHFFCFGGLVPTARWLRAIREGRFEPTSDGGFRVGAA